MRRSPTGGRSPSSVSSSCVDLVSSPLSDDVFYPASDMSSVAFEYSQETTVESLQSVSLVKPVRSSATIESLLPPVLRCPTCSDGRTQIMKMGIYLMTLSLSIESLSIAFSITSTRNRLSESGIIKSSTCLLQTLLLILSSLLFLPSSGSIFNNIRPHVLRRIVSLTLLVVITRSMIEIDLLAGEWETPILSKLSSTYCNMRLVSELSAKCMWHSTWVVFQLKEIVAIVATAAAPVLLVKISLQQNSIQQVTSLIKGIALVLLLLTLFESFVLPLATLYGVVQTREFPDYPVTKINLLIVIVGAVFQLCGLVPVLLTKVSFTSIGLLVSGGFISAVGFLHQLSPIRHGPVLHASSTYQILIAEAASRVLYLTLFAVSIAMCSWSVLV